MNKAIVISIKSRFVADILNGNKTVEIRKTMPKCDLPIDVYIYCSNDSHLILANYKDPECENHYYQEFATIRKKAFTDGQVRVMNWKTFNAKVVAKFTLKEVYTYIIEDQNTWKDKGFEKLVEKTMCLTLNELHKYVGDKTFYGWKIDNLEIFDEPKEVGMFKTYCKNLWLSNKCRNCKYLFIPRSPMTKEECLRPRTTKAPQSWCYVEA